MYSLIFKKNSNIYRIVDAYYKGQWEFDKQSLLSYLTVLEYIQGQDFIDFDSMRLHFKKTEFDNEPGNLIQVIDFIQRENMPVLCNFNPGYIASILENASPGLLTPPTPIIEVTQHCNYNCRWCYIPTRDSTTKRYTLNQLNVNVIEPFLKNFGLLEWCLTGGEPSVEKERTIEVANLIVKRSIDILGMKPLSIYLLTNGFHLSKYAADYYAAGINCYQVALTSPERTTELNLRKPPSDIDSFQEAIEGLKQVKALGGRTEINMILQPDSKNYKTNLYQIPQMFKLAKELKIDMLRIIPAVPSGKAFENDIYFNVTEYDYLEETVAKLRSEYENYFIVDCPIDQEIEGDREVICRAGTLWVYINFFGEVYPCNNLQFPQLRCDEQTIQEKNIKEIWLEAPLLLKMRDYDAQTLSDDCIDCSYRMYCVGECRAMCWARFNTIDLLKKPKKCFKHLALSSFAGGP